MTTTDGLSTTDYPDVWVFDENRRVYTEPKEGTLWTGSNCIWREHWRKVDIVGETSRSWVADNGRTIPKSGGRSISFSEEEIDRAAYVYENKYKIGDAVRDLNDYDLLKQVAALVGYQSEGVEKT